MYASRFRIKNLIIGAQVGGTLATTHRVENYPGTIAATGKELMEKFKEHAISSGSQILVDIVTEIKKETNFFVINTSSGKEFKSHFLIIATGNNWKHLGVPGEKEFLGKGVSYCATCDGMFFRNKTVIVVGGGNTALTQALYLANICEKVYLIHRSENFRSDTSWIEAATKNEKIEIFIIEEIEEIIGDKYGMTGVKLKSGGELEADGIFIAVGTIPNTKLVDHLNPKKDKEGCLLVDQRQETSIKRLFAAGDITTNSNKFRQAITSASEGCIAASTIQEDILKNKTKTGVLLYDLEILAE